MAGREEALRGRGLLHVDGAELADQRLGNAEIQQLDVAVGIDQHIAGFQVAMHDHVAVGMGDGVADRQQQVQALARARRSPGRDEVLEEA